MPSTILKKVSARVVCCKFQKNFQNRCSTKHSGKKMKSLNCEVPNQLVNIPTNILIFFFIYFYHNSNNRCSSRVFPINLKRHMSLIFLNRGRSNYIQAIIQSNSTLSERSMHKIILHHPFISKKKTTEIVGKKVSAVPL